MTKSVLNLATRPGAWPSRLALLAAVNCSLLAACSDSAEDPRVTWLEGHAVELTTVAPPQNPEDDDFSDLEPLIEQIGGARVVMLGEQTHGDGTTFLAKTRLIAFLHQRLGFDVLAFESGTYDMRRTWSLIDSGANAEESMREGVFAIWAGSAQLQPLAAYVEAATSAGTPLQLAGCDIQFSGPANGQAVADELASFLATIESSGTAAPGWPVFSAELVRLGDHLWRDAPPSSEDKAVFDALLSQLIADAAAAPASDEVVFWRRVLLNIEREADRLARHAAGASARELGNLRDQYMGENIVWLAQDRFPNRKIIVWAAMRHTVRNIERIDGSPYGIDFSDAVAMGQVVHDALADDVYSLGFSSGGGAFGMWWSDAQEIPAPVPDSLEDIAARAGLRQAVIDLRSVEGGGEWLQAPFVSRPLGHGDMMGDWSQILDSILFVEQMEPSTPAQ